MHLLKPFQEKAVAELIDHTCMLLALHGQQKQLLLEAPTGSGKTVMAAHYLERLGTEVALRPGLAHKQLAFVWLAPNTLHLQSFESLRSQFADTQKINCLRLEALGANPVLNPNDLLFVNWASLNNQDRIWRRDNEQKANLETLVANTRLAGTDLVLIIDEAQLSAFTGTQATAVRHLLQAKVELSITATPSIRPQQTVVITRQQAVEAEMIKKGVRLNVGLDPEEQQGEAVHAYLLRKGLEKRAELKAAYDGELGPGVLNPLMIVQLPSDKATLSAEDKRIREVVEGLLVANYGISTQNGRLAVWLSEGGNNLHELEKMDGHADVLIFKQAIAQGWDCPRAAVMISYREIGSQTFGIQTVGRILRMPHQRHYRNDELNYGYVFSNIATNHIMLVPSDSDYIATRMAFRQDDKGWHYKTIRSASIVNDRPSSGVLGSHFAHIFYRHMMVQYGVLEPRPVNMFAGISQEDEQMQQAINRKAMESKFWLFNISAQQIPITVNVAMEIDAPTNVVLTADQTDLFTRTHDEFSKALDLLCYTSITRLNRSKSHGKLRSTLIDFAELFLGINEAEAMMVFLHQGNRHLLEQDIQASLEKYDLWQKQRGNANRRVEEESWQVPRQRVYTEDYEAQAQPLHALQPALRHAESSLPEQHFELLLGANEAVEWWYKNGDKGKEHFSIPYKDSAGVLRLFYVDYVVQLKRGLLCLFDTKTAGSDAEAVNKHNALIDYVKAHNAQAGKDEMLGSLLMYEAKIGDGSFRYTNHAINTARSTEGWSFLQLETL